MAERCDRPSATDSERASDYRHNRDDTVLQALVTAGAFVALADGRVKTVEREELMNFITLSKDSNSCPQSRGSRLEKLSTIACDNSKIATAPT